MDIDTVLRQEELNRSLAAQHKLEISSRRNSKRKRPTLPLLVENREIQQTVQNFCRKLRAKVSFLHFVSVTKSYERLSVSLIKFFIKGSFYIKWRGERV